MRSREDGQILYIEAYRLQRQDFLGLNLLCPLVKLN